MKESYKSYVALAVGGVLFALATLAPFAFRGTQQTFIIVSSAPTPGCSAPGSFPSPNQCMNWVTPHATSIATIIGFVLLAAYAFLILQFFRRSGRNLVGKFMGHAVCISTITSAVVSGMYWLMRQHSQALTIAANQAEKGRPFVPVHHQAFGPGISPVAMVLFVLMYVGGVAVWWYILRISPSHIAGIKKDKLFL